MLILWVNAGRGLVQNDNRRIFQHGSGNRNPPHSGAGRRGRPPDHLYKRGEDQVRIDADSKRKKKKKREQSVICLLYTSRPMDKLHRAASLSAWKKAPLPKKAAVLAFLRYVNYNETDH